jgi:hypothetical protein
MKASNSWISEGIATYCETDPLGSQNNRWLYIYQDMTGKGSAYPIESLTFYRIGSFPGVAPMAQLQMYAQSWALVNFLMEKYPNEFMAYQKKMAEKTAGEGEDIKWLLESLGKNKEEVDREFLEYMSTYKKIDDPDVKYFEELYNIFMRD